MRANRRMQSPNERFSDVVPLWEVALRDDGIMIPTSSDADTETLVFRLNRYRVLIRANSPYGLCEHDQFVVRRGNFCVTIARRPGQAWLARATKLDGSPISSPLDNVPVSPFTEMADRYSAVMAKQTAGEPLSEAEQRLARELDKAREADERRKTRGLGLD